MIAIPSSELPVRHSDIPFVLDQKLADQFASVFEIPAGGKPLTMTCGAFAGMFKLLDQFQVEWNRLLHVQQSFEYREAFDLPCPVKAESSLVKLRERGGMKWLTFENILWNEARTKILILAESTIIIQS